MNRENTRTLRFQLKPLLLSMTLAMVLQSAAHASAVRPIDVQSVSYEGTLPSDAAKVLDALVAQVRGKPMDKTQAQVFAQRATAALREAGYPVATVLLTDAAWSQFETNGALTLRAFEGDVGRVVVRNNTSEVESARIQRTAEQALCGWRGAPCVLTTKSLERAELLLQDIPGVKMEPVTLSPEGVTTGQTSVDVSTAASRQRFSGGVGIDNYGVPSSGMNRIGVAVEADNLLHMGDVWQLSGMTTNKQQNTGSFGFSMPLGYDGWRAQANAARTSYELPQVDASGRADSVSAGVSYPITRGFNRNWIASLDAFKVLSEQTVNGMDAFAPSHLTGIRLGATGNAGDRPADLGLSYWSANAALTLGRNKQSISGVDTTGMLGNYTKFAVSAFDKQVLGNNWYGLFNMRAQVVSRNVNNYEAMSLGGITGVRGYSPNEGALDNGLFLSTEIRRLFSVPNAGQFAPGIFIDYITGNVLHSAYPGWQTSLGYANSNLSNHRWLAGWGFGLDWVSPSQTMTGSLTIGRRMPGSPDSEYKRGSADTRLLASMGMKF